MKFFLIFVKVSVYERDIFCIHNSETSLRNIDNKRKLELLFNKNINCTVYITKQNIYLNEGFSSDDILFPFTYNVNPFPDVHVTSTWYQ